MLVVLAEFWSDFSSLTQLAGAPNGSSRSASGSTAPAMITLRDSSRRQFGLFAGERTHHLSRWLPGRRFRHGSHLPGSRYTSHRAVLLADHG
jgi:hypothetical protein